MTSIANDVSLGRQALRRVVNQRIRSNIAWSEDGTIDVFCECGRVRCADRIQIAIVTYDDAVGAPGRYIVIAGHENEDAERLIARQNGFVVVERDRR